MLRGARSPLLSSAQPAESPNNGGVSCAGPRQWQTSGVSEPESPTVLAAPVQLPIELSSIQREQTERFLQLLLEANNHFNLTALRSPQEAWERHVVESLRLVPLLGECARLLDVGSGGGLPGMILAIACPQTVVTLLEATEKKAQFLEATAKELGLRNVTVVCQRAEHAAAAGQPLRGCFDVVSARAVASLRILLELTVPFLRVGGHLLAVKGERADEELAEAVRAMSVLNVELVDSQRHPTATVLLLRKQSETAHKYPRRSGEPKRRPL
jgi:16S rRNA (guanine527-N7)-methyltransferase